MWYTNPPTHQPRLVCLLPVALFLSGLTTRLDSLLLSAAVAYAAALRGMRTDCTQCTWDRAPATGLAPAEAEVLGTAGAEQHTG